MVKQKETPPLGSPRALSLAPFAILWGPSCRPRRCIAKSLITALLFVRKRVLLPPPAAEYRNGADTARPPLLSDTPPPLERVPILALYESNANGGTLTTFTGSGASAPFSAVLRDVLEDDMVLLS